MADCRARPRISAFNIAVFATASALGNSIKALNTLAGVLGGSFLLHAHMAGLQSLPIALLVLATAAAALPAGMAIQHLGPRLGFVIGSANSVLGGPLGAAAFAQNAFWLLCVATMLLGIGYAFVQQYRYAVADHAIGRLQGSAPAWVLGGTLFAAILGPQLYIVTLSLSAPGQYIAAYGAMALLAALGCVVLATLPRARSKGQTDLPSSGAAGPQAAQTPALALAVLISVVSYAAMALSMTAAPLQMQATGAGQPIAAVGIQWHTLAMYAPSLLTGALLRRFGAKTITSCGMLMLMLATAVSMTGAGATHLVGGLILSGIGWNLGFLGGTSLLRNATRAGNTVARRSRCDFVIFSGVAIASLSAGAIFAHFGWQTINWIVEILCLGTLGYLLGTALPVSPRSTPPGAPPLGSFLSSQERH